MKRIVILVLIGGIILSTLELAGAQEKKFKGVTIRYASETCMAPPAKQFREKWEQITGGKVLITTYPYTTLYEKFMTMFSAGVSQYDAIMLPGFWIGTFVGNNFLRDIGSWVLQDKDLNWDEIPPSLQKFAMWEGKTYAIPGDGDTHLLFYRRDLINNPEYQMKFKAAYGYDLAPPKTWKQYREIAEFATGWDWDGDGEVEYGITEIRRKESEAVWTYLSKAAPYTSIPGEKGGLFFDPRDMTPLINSPGHVEALKEYVAIQKYGPPGIVSFISADMRDAMALGRAALTVDWGDTAQDCATRPDSVVKGKIGYAVNPGSEKAWSYVNQKWVNFPDINEAPYLAYGGNVYAVPTTAKHADAGYSFISFLANSDNSLIQCTTPQTAIQPFRKSHYVRLSEWYKAGFIHPDEYLKVYQETFAHPNSISELRIPAVPLYLEVLDAQIALAAVGHKTPQEALDYVAAEWEKITNEYGREKQLELYRKDVGYSE